MNIGTGEGATTVYLYINNGQGIFALGGTATLSGFPFAIGDIDGDGIADIVDSAGCVALGLGNVKFAPDTCYTVPLAEDSYNVVLADLRKNGLKDMVLGLEPMTSVLLNEGNEKFQDGLWTPVANAVNCGAAADFNLDGKQDLAAAVTTGIAMLLGTGNPRDPYTPGPTLTVSGGLGCPTAGDLNNDGIPDLSRSGRDSSFWVISTTTASWMRPGHRTNWLTATGMARFRRRSHWWPIRRLAGSVGRRRAI
jgi:hypothetical protein